MRKLFFFKYIVIGLLLLATTIGFSQDDGNLLGQQNNVITTAVPYLLIGPDARSGGMGEVGVATSPDAYSMHWNPAKYAFINEKRGIGVSYSPWLANLISGINLAYLTYYQKLSDRSGFAGSLRYFSLGEINFTYEDGTFMRTVKPNEFALSGTYTFKFSPNFSGAVAGRFIRSNLTAGVEVAGQTTRPGVTGAADVAVFYTKEVIISGLESAYYNIGANISNIGAKISYSDQDILKNFIPTNLRVGSTFGFNVDEFNQFNISLDLNKLLVPTPPFYDKDEDGYIIYDDQGNPLISQGYETDVSVPQGMIQSFYDAPNGFSEEMKEIIIAVGAEYWYNQQFAIRGGYFNESEIKGNRQFFTLGVGLKYNVLGIDVSYLIPTEQQHPLGNTLRFALTFNFDSLNTGE